MTTIGVSFPYFPDEFGFDTPAALALVDSMSVSSRRTC